MDKEKPKENHSFVEKIIGLSLSNDRSVQEMLNIVVLYFKL